MSRGRDSPAACSRSLKRRHSQTGLSSNIRKCAGPVAPAVGVSPLARTPCSLLVAVFGTTPARCDARFTNGRLANPARQGAPFLSAPLRTPTSPSVSAYDIHAPVPPPVAPKGAQGCALKSRKFRGWGRARVLVGGMESEGRGG